MALCDSLEVMMDQLASRLFHAHASSKSNLAWKLPRVCIKTPVDADTRGALVAYDPGP